MIVAAAMGAVETQSCMLCSFVFFGALPHALASADVRRACCARAGVRHICPKDDAGLVRFRAWRCMGGLRALSITSCVSLTLFTSFNLPLVFPLSSCFTAVSDCGS